MYKEQQVRTRLLEGKKVTESDLKEIDKEVRAIVSDAAAFAKESPEPDPAELWTDVTAPAEQEEGASA